MFVPAGELRFDLKGLIERTIGEWSAVKGAGLIQDATESYGDFIAAELNAADLRRIDEQHDEALFNTDASEGQFREAVIAGLHRWLVETELRPRTPQEARDYIRPLGE